MIGDSGKEKIKAAQSAVLAEDYAKWLAAGNAPYQCANGETAYKELTGATVKPEISEKKAAILAEIEAAQARFKKITVRRGILAPIQDQRFGKLVARKIDPKSMTSHARRWLCDCDCGNVASIRATDLINGHRLWCNVCADRLNPTMKERCKLKPYKLKRRGQNAEATNASV